MNIGDIYEHTCGDQVIIVGFQPIVLRYNKGFGLHDDDLINIDLNSGFWGFLEHKDLEELKEQQGEANEK